MNRYWRVMPRVWACALFLGATVPALSDPALEARPRVLQDLSALPLAFEANQGQANSAVKFLARAPGYQVFLTGQETVMVLGGGPNGRLQRQHAPAGKISEELQQRDGAAVVRMRFEGASPAPLVKGEEPLDFKTNYFLGGESTASFTDIANHGRVKYAGIYPGVDVIYYGNQQQLEYDLLIAPKADPGQVRMRFLGIGGMSLSGDGDLVLATELGDVFYRKPVAYQEIEGTRTPVDAAYLLGDNGQVSFRLGQYDNTRSLVIDPIVSYSTFVWGAAEGLSVDAAGNAYVVGSIMGTNLPATNGYQTKLAGKMDAYVAKLDPTGKIVYATYLGVRNAYTWGERIAIDASGNAYITGTTDSGSFPVTSGVYQAAAKNGGRFITKLNPSGNGLVYSTYFSIGFSSDATIAAIAVDGGGNMYMAGNATSLPATAGAFQTVNPRATTGPSPIIVKLNPTGSAIAYATYLSGSDADEARSIAVDASGSAYVTGVARSANFPTINAYQPALKSRDAFVTKLNATGTGLVYSTYLGGSDWEYGNAIAVNAMGEAFVVGQTMSADFPVTAGVFQRTKGYPGEAVSNGFVTKLSSTGGALVYSTFLGGTWCSICWSASYDNDAAFAVAIDAAGYAYVGGLAKSPAFPTVDSIREIEPVGNGNGHWPFIAKISPQADQLVYSMLLGDGANYYYPVGQIAADLNGNAVGLTNNNGSGLSGTLIPNHFLTAGAVLTTGNSFLLKLDTGKYATTVLSSPNPAVGNQPITFTAKVLSPKLGGNVTFTDGATALGTVPVTGGVAVLAATLPAGVHRVTAVYSLDGKVSLPVYQIVNSN